MKTSPFILLCSTGLFAIFSSTISKSPVLPLFASHLGADLSVVGMVAAVSTFTGIIASIPAGLFSDRIGRKNMLLFSAFIFSTAPFLYLFVTELWQLAIVRFYHGLATAIFIPVAMALVADLFHKERGEKMGLFSTSTLIGRFMAPIVGGSIIGLLAFNPGFSYKIVYLVCGAAGVIALVLAFKLPDASIESYCHSPTPLSFPDLIGESRGHACSGNPEKKELDSLVKPENDTRKPCSKTTGNYQIKEWGNKLSPPLEKGDTGGFSEKQDWKETFASFKSVISNRLILITAGVEAAILFAYGTFETFLPLYAIKLGISAYEVGIFLSAQVITLALTKPIMGRFSDKHGRQQQIFGGALIGAICIGSFSFFKSFLPMLALSILFGLSLSIVTSATSAFIADLSREKTHGSAMGIFGSIMDMGHTTGPLISGFVAAYLGFEKAFIGAALVLATAASLFFIHIMLTRKNLSQHIQ